MSDDRAALGKALMDGLSCYRHKVDPVADPAAYAACVRLYVDDLAAAGVTVGILTLALRHLRATYRRHDWPVVAEILEAVGTVAEQIRPRLPRGETKMEREERARQDYDAMVRAERAGMSPEERDILGRAAGLMMRAAVIARDPVRQQDPAPLPGLNYFKRLAAQGITKDDLPGILTKPAEKEGET